MQTQKDGKRTKQVNLLNNGTGIRFKSFSGGGPKLSVFNLAWFAVFLTSTFAVIYIYYSNYYLSGRQMTIVDIFHKPKLAAPADTSPHLEPAQNAAPMNAPLVGISAPIYAPIAKPEIISGKPVVRFGIFMSRNNAERMVQNLQKHDIFCEIRIRVKPISAYTLSVWPIKQDFVAKRIIAELEKNSVALTPRLEREYLVAGPIWTKDGANSAVAKARDLGLQTSITEKVLDKEVYDVISMPLDNEVVAQYKIGEWHNMGFEGVIEK